MSSVNKKVIEVFFPTLDGELITYSRASDYHPDADVLMSEWAATIFTQGGRCSYGYVIDAAMAVIDELEKADSKGDYGLKGSIVDLESAWDYRPPINALSSELQSQVVYPDKANPYLPRWMITTNGQPLWQDTEGFLKPTFERVAPKENIGIHLKEDDECQFSNLYPILTAQRIMEQLINNDSSKTYSLVRGEPLKLSFW